MNRTTSENSPPREWDLILKASQKNLTDEILFLVQHEGVSPSHSNAVGQSALHIAALWGNVESVEMLIALGANVNTTNKLTRGTPLHGAIHSRSKTTSERRRECCRLLVEGGADVSIQDRHGSIPADYVSELNDACLLEMLLPKKPEIFRARNAEELHPIVTPENVDKTFGGKTLLLKLVQDLLQHPENKSEKKTPYIMVEMIQVLLQNGADPNATPSNDSMEDTSGDPPLMRVCLALKDLCKNNFITENETIQDLEIVARLLHQGGANVQDLYPLVLDGARRNELEFVQFCFSSLNISPNIKGRQGMTPLHFAARSGKAEMVQYLLDNFDNLDLDAKNDFGQTALDAARTNNKEEIVALLEHASVMKSVMEV